MNFGACEAEIMKPFGDAPRFAKATQGKQGKLQSGNRNGNRENGLAKANSGYEVRTIVLDFDCGDLTPPHNLYGR